ncbi:transporter substrate-binding domain-containing diguanylate cyclase [Clostridium sp.]|uniref:transporter substrate-binding domain-containing diguanylate cyclase n=1 Tax=Clostridium sp. TaxID=1506 RepID=UPI003EECE063
MKNTIKIIVFTYLLLILWSTFAFGSVDTSLKLTVDEKQWLIINKDKIFTLGINPGLGMEYFKYKDEEKGYLIPLIALMEKDLGININLKTSNSWGEVFSALHTGKIDILFGANETVERKKTMYFTQPIYKIPYALITKKGDSIRTIGDIDNKAVGFITDDIVIDLLPTIYKNIRYKAKFYASPEECITAISRNKIDALITSGGPVVFDYIYRFPELNYAFKLNSITSDLTLSTTKDNEMLFNILEKEINHLKGNILSKIINSSEVDYNLNIMNLTPSEINWLENDGKAVVGITKDYLPFDYFLDGEYKGISGQIINEISRKTGIEFINKYGEFDDLNNKLKNGQIDILNIAKTEDRLKYLLYPQPYSTERDIIVGRKDSKDALDIFGLEGKKVAVIKGFWHYEHLMKNLTSVEIIETSSIQESMLMVHNGRADYLIENPTVVRYYTEELQLFDLVEKGGTSTDSYLYYGVAKGKPELASIIDKVIPMLDINQLIKKGYDEVPHVSNKKYLRKLTLIIVVLGAILIFVILYVVKLFKALIKEKLSTELLRQREEFLYTDPLTNLYNRNYFSSKIKDTLDFLVYPQSFIIADINNLKITNDRYGHLIGDLLLKQFADTLTESCPSECLLVRMGGDEFLIILENANELMATEIIEALKIALTKNPIIITDNEIINVTTSFGYATRYSTNETFDEMFKTADARMYDEKRMSKN